VTAPDRLLVALDVESLAGAGRLLDRLAGVVTGCKSGSRLFTVAGPAAVELALKRGFRVFLDLKFHDIPNTVAGAVREATRLGVFMLNVHAGGGTAMMRAAAEAAAGAAREFGVQTPVCLGVTVLTSHDEGECGVIFGDRVTAKVFQFACLLIEAGAAPYKLDALVVVAAPLAMAARRLKGRSGWSFNEVKKRQGFQLPLQEKVRRADFVVKNAGSIASTRRQVIRIWKQILKENDNG
jgi:orotidine-5'-phosphate decarboxylase